MDVKYIKNGKLNSKEILEVFKSVGWNKEEDNIIEAFKNSYYITAYVNDKLVGFSRAISDNHYYTGVYDVIVMPEYQKNGIGKNMMNIILDEFKGTYFFLTYTEGKREFYEKCGFKDNDNSMWIPR
ncbi:MAG: GNAT family N-acetyltransferase [Firmicutes bacterium]|nr:GNAT family N-acetyltransferase [Bacillota bacterium]